MKITNVGITLFHSVVDSRNGFERKSHGKTHCLRHSLDKPFASRAANCKEECVLKACLFYLGHTKFPDRMASRTARVRKPTYKHCVDADATQTCRFVDRLESPHDRSALRNCRICATILFNNYETPTTQMSLLVTSI